MVAIDYRAPQLCADTVELVAELRHLVRAVLIAGYNLVNRVNNNRDVVLLGSAPDKLWRQLVHWHRLAAQVPDINVLQVRRYQVEGRVNIFKTMQAARPVKLQVDIQYFALGAVESYPLAAFGDGDAQLDERERLTGLAWTGQEHLVTLAQHS